MTERISKLSGSLTQHSKRGTSQRDCTARDYSILMGEAWSTKEWILHLLIPSPQWMGEVLKTSEKASTMRAYLGWKHHEAPWDEYYNSTPSPYGWKRYLKQVRRPPQWELILVGSTMKHHGMNITTPPPPPMDRKGNLNSQEGLHSESLSWLEAPWSTGVNITTPPPPPMDGRGT